MKTTWLKRLSDERGVTALEFAVVFPFFLMILLFLIEFARQQIVMTLVERTAVQATVYARMAEDRSTLGDEIRDLFDVLPSWIYDNNPSNLTIEAVYGDNLTEVMSSPLEGYGSKGQTVCLRISTTAGIIGWLPENMSPRSARTIESCFTNAH